MNLYLIWQTANRGYDTYDSCVVAANSEDEARLINPDGKWKDWSNYRAWCESPDSVKVKLIGVADASVEAGIVLASFNAG